MGWVPFKRFDNGVSTATAYEVAEPAGCIERPLHLLSITEGDNSCDERGVWTVYATKQEAVDALQVHLDREASDKQRNREAREGQRQRLSAHIAKVVGEVSPERSLAALWNVIYYDSANPACFVDCYLRHLGVEVWKRGNSAQ